MVSLFSMSTVCLEDPVLFEEIYGLLSEKRQEKIGFYRFRKDQRLSMAAGCLMDYGLRSFGMNEKTARIRYGENGKPYLEEKPLFFNLSHCNKLAVCGFSDREIGVDTEELYLPDQALMERVCVPQELQYLCSLDEESRAVQFTKLWTLKESYMKYLGTGLTLDPLALEINFCRPETLLHNSCPVSVCFRTYPVENYFVSICCENEDFPAFPLLINFDDIKKQIGGTK